MIYLPLLLLLFRQSDVCAQNSDNVRNIQRKWSISTGLGTDWSAETRRYNMLEWSYRLTPYYRFGAVYSFIFSQKDAVARVFLKNGHEWGGYFEYLVHTPFTNRLTNYFMGVELLYGRIRYMDQYKPPFNFGVPVLRKSTKLLFRWGARWSVGRLAFLQLYVPMGLELKTRDATSISPAKTRVGLTLMPGILLGATF